MTKLLSTLGLALTVAMVTMLAGCDLYFGKQDPSSGGGDRPPGYSCGSDSQCAAGCYCSDGTCTEGGFCSTDGDCGPGFHCDTDRSSCVPNADCTCNSDAEAVAQGFGWCDESTHTCNTGDDPAGNCTGAVTCTDTAPRCAEHQVPLVFSGCYTGQCRDISACEGPSGCGSLQHEDDCLARATDCAASYTGINCHKPDGSACHAGDTNCTCQSFSFNTCVQRGAARTDSFGNYVSGFSTYVN